MLAKIIQPVETFRTALQQRSEETTVCQQSTLSYYPSCSVKVGTGLGLVGRWMALGQFPSPFRGYLMDSSKVLIQQLPQTSLTPQQQEQGTRPDVDISFQGTLQAIQSKLKTSPRKGSRWLNFVLELPHSFGNQPLFNTPSKIVKVSLNITC